LRSTSSGGLSGQRPETGAVGCGEAMQDMFVVETI
jgi:hypothetical protein